MQTRTIMDPQKTTCHGTSTGPDQGKRSLSLSLCSTIKRITADLQVLFVVATVKTNITTDPQLGNRVLEAGFVPQ